MHRYHFHVSKCAILNNIISYPERNRNFLNLQISRNALPHLLEFGAFWFQKTLDEKQKSCLPKTSIRFHHTRLLCTGSIHYFKETKDTETM